MNPKSNFFIRRLHSLLALIPIAIFIVVHFLINSSVFIGDGTSSYAIAITFMKSSVIIKVMEVVIIALPLLVHAVYGIYVVYVAKNNALQYKYVRNWNFYLQRITAVIIVVFLIVHVITLRFMQHEPMAVVETISGYLQNPLWFAFYVVGILSALYHLGNGFLTFCITWGICAGEKAQKIFYYIGMAIFLALSVWAVALLIKIANLPIV